jgi:hypothetical protein
LSPIGPARINRFSLLLAEAILSFFTAAKSGPSRWQRACVCPLHRIEIQYFFTLHKTRRISSFLRSREKERKGGLIYDVLNHLVISYSANMHVVHLFRQIWSLHSFSLVVIDLGLFGSNFSLAAFEIRYFRSQLTPSGQPASCQPTIKNK